MWSCSPGKLLIFWRVVALRSERQLNKCTKILNALCRTDCVKSMPISLQECGRIIREILISSNSVQVQNEKQKFTVLYSCSTKNLEFFRRVVAMRKSSIQQMYYCLKTFEGIA